MSRIKQRAGVARLTSGFNDEVVCAIMRFRCLAPKMWVWVESSTDTGNPWLVFFQ